MKILVVRGHGLGSSFVIEMNVQEALRQPNAPSDIGVEHSDVMTVSPETANLFICGRDLAENAERLGGVLVLDNILDKAGLRQKLSEKLQQLNII